MEGQAAMTPALRLARYHARHLDRPGAFAAMIAALYMLTGPRRDGTRPFTLRRV